MHTFLVYVRCHMRNGKLDDSAVFDEYLGRLKGKEAWSAVQEHVRNQRDVYVLSSSPRVLAGMRFYLAARKHYV